MSDSWLSELMTATQIADLLQMKRSTVDDYARRGVLPSIKLGRHRRFVKSDVEAALAQLRDGSSNGASSAAHPATLHDGLARRRPPGRGEADGEHSP